MHKFYLIALFLLFFFFLCQKYSKVEDPPQATMKQAHIVKPKNFHFATTTTIFLDYLFTSNLLWKYRYANFCATQSFPLLHRWQMVIKYAHTYLLASAPVRHLGFCHYISIFFFSLFNIISFPLLSLLSFVGFVKNITSFIYK